MTYRQIEQAREIRLWIGQIIVPAATLVTPIILANPEITQRIATNVRNMKETINGKVRVVKRES